jgi:hypothetical protein
MLLGDKKDSNLGLWEGRISRKRAAMIEAICPKRQIIENLKCKAGTTTSYQNPWMLGGFRTVSVPSSSPDTARAWVHCAAPLSRHPWHLDGPVGTSRQALGAASGHGSFPRTGIFAG